jgi:hypothetical protein
MENPPTSATIKQTLTEQLKEYQNAPFNASKDKTPEIQKKLDILQNTKALLVQFVGTKFAEMSKQFNEMSAEHSKTSINSQEMEKKYNEMENNYKELLGLFNQSFKLIDGLHNEIITTVNSSSGSA